MRRDVFQAIADPTRRQIISMIAHGPLNLNAVSVNFNVSRPAISKHIKILTECGLIEIRQQGRERYCEAKLQKLNEVSEWIEQYRKFWTNKLDALGNFLHQTSTGRALPMKNPKSTKTRKNVSPIASHKGKTIKKDKSNQRIRNVKTIKK
jgi:DNA-binding transcriptional ArsR family regulator